MHLPPAPFQNAWKPSSWRIFLKQSMTPLYDVWPARAATWSLVLMTSAGVTSDAAGTPWERFHNRHNEALSRCTDGCHILTSLLQHHAGLEMGTV